jgi:TetR/AcrR family transcriptional regulator, fatty acid metabolism regulator protein
MRSSQQREEAVKLVTEGGLTIPEAGRRLSIAPSTLRYWIKASGEDKNVGNKQKPLAEIEVELARVKRELARSVIMSNKITRRQSILQAAIEVFSKKGFQTASISEIAQGAGIADATIYKYFKNKEDLFFAIPIEKTKEFRSQLELHLEGISGAFNKIRKFVWYFLYFFKANPEYGRILLLDIRVSKSFVKTETYDFLKQSVSQVMNIIREGQNEGVIRRDIDIYILRHSILGMLEHMVCRWLLKGEKYDLLEHHQEVCQVLIDGLKAMPPNQST